LVDAIVGALDLDRLGGGPVRVLDPACGDGRFLAAVADRLGRRAELHGVDIDPVGRVPGGSFVCADALARDWTPGSFDVVVGNPPFLNQLATATTRGGASRFGGGPYANSAAEFLALAVQLARPGGLVGLVLPQSLLAARDAAAIRAAVDERAALRWCWWSERPVFDAAVATWAGVWEVGGAPGPVERRFGSSFEERPAIDPQPGPSWSWLLGSAVTPSIDACRPRLGSIAEFTVDFRDVYYGLVDAVGDDVDGPPLVTTGLIDPGRCHWGQRPVRFAKRRWRAPRVDLDRLSPTMRRWADRRLVAKILVANQARWIEAVHDAGGEWLPGVPVLTCTTDQPARVLDVLAGPAATAWVHHHAAGSGLGPTTVRLTPALLASIPLR
jgi:hypothetical protein